MKTGRLEWTPVLEVDENHPDGFIGEFYFRSSKWWCVKSGRLFKVFLSRCPHNGTPFTLSGLDFASGTITCFHHGYCFKLEDGSLLSGASSCVLKTLPVRVFEGKLYVGTEIPWWKF